MKFDKSREINGGGSSSDELLPVGQYIKRILFSADGFVLLLICLGSLLGLVDVALSIGLVPIRDYGNPPKAMVLLAFSPLIAFLVIVCARQLPFSRSRASAGLRVFLCVFVFLILNF